MKFEEFYSKQSSQYSSIMHTTLSKRYISADTPALHGDADLIHRMQELITVGAHGLDAGCGAGARDVFIYHQAGYIMTGLDYVKENIDMARETHPEIAECVSTGNLGETLKYKNNTFDFVLCNCVIQHIQPEIVRDVSLTELVRVLKPGGILQFMFKSGTGFVSVFDPEYNINRDFYLYESKWICDILAKHNMSIIPRKGNKLGGLMNFTDPKPMEHCVFYAQKEQNDK